MQHIQTLLRSIKLSTRECEVAGHLLRGLGNKEIADLLFIEEKTVKFHNTNIYKKTGVRSRAQFIYEITQKVAIREPAQA